MGVIYNIFQKSQCFIGIVLFLVFLMPLVAFGKQPIGFKHWRLNDTTFVKNIGGAIRNYQKPDKAWDSIVNRFEVEGDSVVYVDKSVLRTRVNKNGVSKVMLTWDGQEYTITQKMLGIGWIKISTRQSQWIDSTMNWGNFHVDSNIATWTGVSPGVNYRVRKNNGTVEHGVFLKPAFLDSAVTLYNQRPDSLDIALANVMVYTLSANIDDADSAIGDVSWRKLKDFGYYSFNLTEQRLHFPGSDSLPEIPVKQYWERRGTKIICIEYVMMSHIKKVHEVYPSATIWHNDFKKIEGTTNVEDTYIKDGASSDLNFGVSAEVICHSVIAWDKKQGLIRVLNVASEIGVGATITGAVCSVYVFWKSAACNISAYRVFKPWEEGAQSGSICVGPGCTWNDWACTDKEWTTEGCLCANDDGVDNSYDGGVCNQAVRADRKATAECTEAIDAYKWYGFDVSSALAQDWYDGSANENGLLFRETGVEAANFRSTESGPVEFHPFWVFTYTGAAEGDISYTRRTRMTED